MSEQGPESKREPILAEVVDVDEGLVSPAELGSASRSCLAIIALMALIILIICVFLTAQLFR